MLKKKITNILKILKVVITFKMITFNHAKHWDATPSTTYSHHP